MFRTNPAWSLVGLVLLGLRYRRTGGTQRRQTRWLLLGMVISFGLWIPAGLLWQLASPDSVAAGAASQALSDVAGFTTMGSLLAALFHTGVFGIDQPARRAFVHRVLRFWVGAAIALLAVVAGMLASLAVPAAAAVAVTVTAGAAGQAVRRRLEHAADRWVLGARLAGYASLSRFGESLTRAPGSDALLRDLAGEIRRGLGLPGPGSRWNRRASPPLTSPSSTGAPSSGGSSAVRAPMARCWPRTAGSWRTSAPMAVLTFLRDASLRG